MRFSFFFFLEMDEPTLYLVWTLFSLWSRKMTSLKDKDETLSDASQ